MSRVEEGVRLQTFDLAAISELRRTWGVFRDRRPELYGRLLSIDGKLRFPAT
jgi:N-carbamoylputrescine amidase